jgi:hypothetical protein
MSRAGREEGNGWVQSAPPLDEQTLQTNKKNLSGASRSIGGVRRTLGLEQFSVLRDRPARTGEGTRSGSMKMIKIRWNAA